MNLLNKNILVTGASKGIGYAIADYLMNHGANVAIHFNSGQDAARELVVKYPNTKSHCFQADLSQPESVKALFYNVLSEYNSLDSIVLNAGVFLGHPITSHIDDWFEIWKKTLAINLDSVGLITKLGIDHFKSQTSGGRFIYIGSRATFRGETQEYLAYAASRGGLTSLARSVARSFGKENIKAFVVAPGFTRTQMADAFIETYGEERILSEIALNELTTPEDIAPLVGLMCSGLMDHATGATIDVNAGSHIR